MQEYGGVEGIVSAAVLNGLSLDADLSADTLVVIDEVVEAVVRKTISLPVSITAPENLTDLSIQYESMIDAAMRLYESVEGIVVLARDNSVSVDSDFSGSQVLKINQVIAQALSIQKPSEPVVYQPAQDSVIVANGQSVIDLLVQEYGNVEGIISFLRLNVLGATDTPSGAVKIDLLSISDKVIRNYFSGRVINTGYTGAAPAGNFELREDNFYILREDGNKILREN